MNTFILIKLVGIILLVMGNAYFVGAEIALTSARRSRVHHLANMETRLLKWYSYCNPSRSVSIL